MYLVFESSTVNAKDRLARVRSDPKRARAGARVGDARDHRPPAGFLHRDIKPENIILSGPAQIADSASRAYLTPRSRATGSTRTPDSARRASPAPVLPAQ